jgi:hypothetical protein
MRRIRHAFAALIALTLLLGVVPLATPQASAAVNTWVIIHARSCPTSSTGNIFKACHGKIVRGADFEIGGTAVSSSSKGTAKAKVTPGRVVIKETDFATQATAGRAYIFCSLQPHGSPVLLARNTTTGAVAINIKQGQVVYCDWYNRTT